MSCCWPLVLGFLLVLNVRAKVETACGDGSFCPSGTTCCEIAGGSFGCCPIPDAVCCADKLHCCPNGMTCDTVHAQCTDGQVRQPLQRKILAERRDETASSENNSVEEDDSSESKLVDGSERCKDKKSTCPKHTTCCSSGGHPTGCCPMENAVCCEDGEHCCPSGNKCNLEEETCDPAEGNENTKSQPWFERLASTRVIRKTGVPYRESWRECSNGDTCNSQSTCCHDSDNGEASCCPFLNGQCCRGGKKCCGEGFSCSKFGDECVREENGVHVSMQMIETKGARGAESNLDEESDQRCPDNSRCPPDHSCCPIRSHSNGEIDGYQCCPLTKAVCCADFCCPLSYHCSSSGQCKKSGFDFRANKWFN